MSASHRLVGKAVDDQDIDGEAVDVTELRVAERAAVGQYHKRGAISTVTWV